GPKNARRTVAKGCMLTPPILADEVSSAAKYLVAGQQGLELCIIAFDGLHEHGGFSSRCERLKAAPRLLSAPGIRRTIGWQECRPELDLGPSVRAGIRSPCRFRWPIGAKPIWPATNQRALEQGNCSRFHPAGAPFLLANEVSLQRLSAEGAS